LLVAAGICLVVNASTSALPGPAGPACHIRAQVTRPHVKTVVGEMNNAYPGGKTSFSYGNQADSSISTAVSVNGGPFELGTAKHVSNASGSTGSFTRGGPYARKVIGFFTYDKKRYFCKDRFGDSRKELHVEPVAWEGSIIGGRALPAAINRCRRNSPNTVRVPPGYVFSTSSEHAATWSNAAKVFGAGLSAQSGFSSFVTETITMPKAKGRYYICGSDGPPATASRVFTGLKQ